MDWSMLAGPLVGAVIGYFTNYLAVKMLFRPRHEVLLFGKRLPFTPGVIPKGKKRLAKAVGDTVAGTLITGDDLCDHLLSDSMKHAVAGRVIEFTAKSVKEVLTDVTEMDEVRFAERKGAICEALGKNVYDSLMDMDIKGQTSAAVREMAAEKLESLKQDSMIGGMISMFLPDEKVASLADQAGEKMEQYVADHSMEIIMPAVMSKADDFEDTTGMYILRSVGVTPEGFKRAVLRTYEKVVRDNMDSVLKYIDLSSLIETKINEMPVEDLEKMVLSVMKRELNMIVRLGALIGAVIGTINIFI